MHQCPNEIGMMFLIKTILVIEIWWCGYGNEHCIYVEAKSAS